MTDEIPLKVKFPKCIKKVDVQVQFLKCFRNTSFEGMRGSRLTHGLSPMVNISSIAKSLLLHGGQKPDILGYEENLSPYFPSPTLL